MSADPAGTVPLAMRSRWTRATSGIVAASGLMLLGVSRWLEPAAAGHGTHLQLGLRPCTFLEWTGWPCPMCGATTTFALMADFQWVAGLINQPFAALLFVCVVVITGFSIVELLRPQGSWTWVHRHLRPVEGRVAMGLLVLMAASWLYKITIMPIVLTG